MLRVKQTLTQFVDEQLTGRQAELKPPLMQDRLRQALVSVMEADVFDTAGSSLERDSLPLVDADLRGKALDIRVS